MSTATARRHACERCWKRKQKCDREHPSCSLCRDAGVQCAPRTVPISLEGGSPGGVSYIGESYVQGLKRSIDSLQQLSQRKRQRVQGLSSDNEARGEEVNNDRRSQPSGSRQGPSVHDALTDFSHFGLNSSPTERDRDHGTETKTLSTWSFVKRIGFLAKADPSAQAEDEAILRTMLTQTSLFTMGLTQDMVNAAVDRYRDTVLQAYPFVDGDTLRTICLSAITDSGPAPPATGGQDALLAYIVLMSSYAKGYENYASSMMMVRLRADAMHLCPKIEDSDAISTMRCLTAMALHTFYGSDMTAAANLIGIALSKAVALGFHRLAFPKHTASGVVDAARRIFSTLFVLERSLNLATGQPNALDDRDIAPEALQVNTSPDVEGHSAARPDFNVLGLQIDFLYLVVDMRKKRGKPPVYFVTIYRTWLEHSAQCPDSGSAGDETILRLKCRLFLELLWMLKCKPGCQDGPPTLDPGELEDGLKAFAQWLKSVQAMSDDGSRDICVLDPFDICSIALTSTCVRRDSGYPSDAPMLQLFSEIQMLSISLLGGLSKASPVNAAMRRLVSSIELDASLGRSREGTHHVQGIELVPRKLRQMLVALEASASV